MAKNKIPAWKLWDDSFTADDARRTREEMGIFPKQEDEENRLAELGSILTELEKEGLSQEQLSAIADQYMATGRFDVPTPAAPQSLADFSNVQVGVRSTEDAPSEMSLLDKLSGIYSPGIRNLPQVGEKVGAVVDAAQAGGWRDLANVTERAALENIPSNTIGLAAMLGGQDLIDGNYDRFLSRFGRGAAKPLAEDIAAMRNSAAANKAAADEVLAPIVAQGGAGGLLARTAQDAADSGLSSAVSLVGGPVGALTAGGVSYAGAYKEAVDAGASPAAAEVYALTQGGIEGLFSVIPAGKYLDKVPFLGALAKKGKDELLQKVTDPAIAAAVKTAKAVVGESAQESATGAAQDLVGAAVAGAVSNDELGKQHSSEGFWERREREALAGGAMGGALTAPVAAASEASRYAKEMEDRGRLARAGAQREALSERNRNAVDLGTAAEQEADFSGESQLDTLRRQGAERRKQAEIDAAYAQREAEQRAVREQELNIDEEIAATQKEVEEEAGFRTVERDAAAPSDRVERLPDGTVERIPVQPAAPITAEEVLADEELSALDKKAWAAETEKLRLRTVLEGRQKAADQKGAKEQLAAATKLHTEQSKRERDVADGVLRDMPDASPVELEAEFARRLAAPVVPVVPVSPTQELIEEQNKKKATADKARQTAADTNRRKAAIAAARRENPDATPAELAAIADAKLAGVEGQEVPASNEDARARARSMNLGMAAEEAAARSGVDYNDKVSLHRIGKAAAHIASRQTKESVGLENLIAQGKLIITTSADFVGRNDTGRAGEYDPDTNRMYIYLDNLSNKDVVQGILEEIGTHESTHLGSLNSREGRSAVMSALMGDGDVAGAARRIREASRNGNKIAQAAESFIPEGERDGAVGDLELLAYFTNAVRKNRGGTLGSLRGVANDMVANARGVLRDKIGLDLDITINDLASAVSDVTMEAARTDTSGPINVVEGFNNQTLDDSLGMVLSTTAKEFPEQNKNGRVYKGMRDGKRRFVISDKEALTTHDPETIDALLKGEEIPLGEVLQHQRLYDNLPWLMDGITVRMDDSVPSAQFEPAADDPRRGTIALSRRNAAQLDTPEARNTILHEVQHAVQNEVGLSSGANIERFIPSKVKSELKRLNKALDAVIARFDLTAALEAIPPAMRQEVEGVFSDRSMSLPEKREYILRSGLAADSSNRAVSTFAKNVYAKARQEQNDAARAYNEAYERAKDAYARAYGETEARTTEQTSDLTQEELDSRPFETRFGEKPYFENEPVYDVNVEDTYDADSVRAGVQPPKRRSASPSLGMAAAAEATNMSTEGFKRWWRNGKVKNKDGSPMRLFHGTRAGADYSEFRIGEGEIGIHVGTAEQAGDPAFVGSLYGRFDETVGKVGEGQAGPRIHPVYINLQNPLRVEADDFGMGPSLLAGSLAEALDAEGHKASGDRMLELAREARETGMPDVEAFAAMRSIIEDAGFDGLVYRNTAEGTRMEPTPGESPVMSRLHYPYGAEGHADSYVVFHPNQIKSVNNSGEFSRHTNNTLGMASPASWVKENIATKSPKAQVESILRYQTNEYNADVANYESMFAQWKNAENNYEGDVVQARDEINKMLLNVDKLEGEAKQKAWSEFERAYPSFAPIVKDAREQIDANSRAIVKSILDGAEGRELSPEENSAINTVLDGMGKYTHRAYATLQRGDTGATARKGRLKALDAVKEGRKDIPRKMREDYDAVVDALEFIQNRLTIPPVEEMMASRVETLDTLYSTWVGNPDSLIYDKDGGQSARKEALVEALDQRRASITPTSLQDKAYEAIETLLGVHDSSAYAQASGALARDTGVMRKREKVPAAIRKLLGEYTDPSARVLLTLANQSGWMTRQKMLAEIREQGEGTAVVSPETVATSGRGKFVHKLSGQQYGALDGWYATPEVFNTIKTVEAVTHTWQEAWEELSAGRDAWPFVTKSGKLAGEGLRKLAATAKFTSVIMNPFKWFRDGAGSVMFLVQNGNYQVGSYGLGVKAGVDYVASSWSGNVTESLDDFIRYVGVESARVGELQKILGEDVRQVANGTYKGPGIPKKLFRSTVAARSMVDTWTKYANFVARTNDLRSFYEKAGIEKSLEEIKREAGEDVSFTNISYDRAPGIVKAMEKHGVSMYFPYMTEVVRVSWTNYVQGVRDLNRAAQPGLPSEARNVMLRAGLARLVGNSLALSTPLLLAAGAGALAGDDDDKWRRLMISPFNRDQDLLWAGVNEDGMPAYLPVGMMDPLGPVTDLMRVWITHPGTEEEKAKAIAEKAVELYITPTWMARVARAATGTIPDPSTSRILPDQFKWGQDALNEVGISENTFRRSMYAAEAWAPSWYKAFDTRYAPGEGGDIPAKTLRAFGAQFESIDPARRLRDVAFEQTDDRRLAHNVINVALANDPAITQDRLHGLLVDFKDAEMKRLKEIYYQRVSLEKWGQDEAAIKGLMKGAGIAERDIKAIYAAEPKATLSVQSMDQFVESKLGSKAEQEQMEATYKENLRKLKASREWLASLGIELEN